MRDLSQVFLAMTFPDATISGRYSMLADRGKFPVVPAG
jgi:hypothetical protein